MRWSLKFLSFFFFLTNLGFGSNSQATVYVHSPISDSVCLDRAGLLRNLTVVNTERMTKEQAIAFCETYNSRIPTAQEASQFSNFLLIGTSEQDHKLYFGQAGPGPILPGLGQEGTYWLEGGIRNINLAYFEGTNGSTQPTYDALPAPRKTMCVDKKATVPLQKADCHRPSQNEIANIWGDSAKLKIRPPSPKTLVKPPANTQTPVKIEKPVAATPLSITETPMPVKPFPGPYVYVRNNSTFAPDICLDTLHVIQNVKIISPFRFQTWELANDFCKRNNLEIPTPEEFESLARFLGMGTATGYDSFIGKGSRALPELNQDFWSTKDPKDSFHSNTYIFHGSSPGTTEAGSNYDKMAVMCMEHPSTPYPVSSNSQSCRRPTRDELTTPWSKVTRADPRLAVTRENQRKFYFQKSDQTTKSTSWHDYALNCAQTPYEKCLKKISSIVMDGAVNREDIYEDFAAALDCKSPIIDQVMARLSFRFLPTVDHFGKSATWGENDEHFSEAVNDPDFTYGWTQKARKVVLRCLPELDDQQKLTKLGETESARQNSIWGAAVNMFAMNSESPPTDEEWDQFVNTCLSKEIAYCSEGGPDSAYLTQFQKHIRPELLAKAELLRQKAKDEQERNRQIDPLQDGYGAYMTEGFSAFKSTNICKNRQWNIGVVSAAAKNQSNQNTLILSIRIAELIKILFSDRFQKDNLGQEPGTLAQAITDDQLMRKNDPSNNMPMNPCNILPGQVAGPSNFLDLIVHCALRKKNETGSQTQVCRDLVESCANDKDPSNLSLDYCSKSLDAIRLKISEEKTSGDD